MLTLSPRISCSHHHYHITLIRHYNITCPLLLPPFRYAISTRHYRLPLLMAWLSRVMSRGVRQVPYVRLLDYHDATISAIDSFLRHDAILMPTRPLMSRVMHARRLFHDSSSRLRFFDIFFLAFLLSFRRRRCRRYGAAMFFSPCRFAFALLLSYFRY